MHVLGRVLAKLQVCKYPSVTFQTSSQTNSCCGSLQVAFLPVVKTSYLKQLGQAFLTD